MAAAAPVERASCVSGCSVKRELSVAEQLELRERVLSAFERQAAADAGVTKLVAADAC